MDASWIDRIHTRLLARYGAAWVRMWADIDMGIVKADWADQLNGLSAESIRHALDHLPPDRPPNAAQFKALCLSRPEPELPRLPAPQADPARVQRELRKLSTIKAGINPLAWAHRLENLEMTGGRLTPIQRRAWREALGVKE